MGPRNLRRAVQDDILQVLGDGAVRGDRLLDALSEIGARTATEPFSTALDCTIPGDVSETGSRDTVAAIERHRLGLEALLGRDPGFLVAAFDLLHDKEGVGRDPVFREFESGEGASSSREESCAPGDFEDALRFEIRRMNRSGLPLVMLLLSPEACIEPSNAPPTPSLAALRDSLRDTDVVAMLPTGEVGVLLPCTGGQQGLMAARRLGRTLLELTGHRFHAGVAAAHPASDAGTLKRDALQGLQEARRTVDGAALHQTDRRAHARFLVGGRLAGRVRSAGAESEVRIVDLSLGGALLSSPGRLETDGEFVLALRGSGTRPVGFLIPSRVLRAGDDPSPGGLTFMTAVQFGSGARTRIAALLAGLDAPGARRAP